MHWDSSVIKKKPGVKQRKAIQRLRDLLVCVRSEAARRGPERYVLLCITSATMAMLSSCLLSFIDVVTAVQGYGGVAGAQRLQLPSQQG
ncbi:MAG: hypothetical protein HC767_00090 [Akkermansiaceae bacterium]|nr:hypothetical protein [Akkermansiaceae bacterium]